MVVKQKTMGLNGDEAVAYAAKQALVDVVSAYPITPQTIIVEKFSEFVHDGETQTEFVPVESEHSAMSCVCGAAAAGARTFTASAANGLQLMDEICYIAAGNRLPIVMAIASRAPAAPINIHCDHNDSMNLRDSGWIQLFTENPQEAYDTTLQAFKIAEHLDIQLPIMVMLDGFVVSHSLANVNMLSDKDASEFVGEREIPLVLNHHGKMVPQKLDPANPITMGPLVLTDYYLEVKKQQMVAMENALKIISEVNEEYSKLSGRKYGNGLLEIDNIEDAEVIIVCMASTAGTARVVMKELREEGKKVGLVRVRSFRPFPHSEIRKTLENVPVIGVMDRGISFGSHGQLFTEIRSTMYESDKKPILIDYVYGLGGRDTPPTTIREIYEGLLKIKETGKPGSVFNIQGVRE
ncbi:MAG: pyruvate ferredoxin oxidoreductase [Candidatus Ranarchaeia archaeon]